MAFISIVTACYNEEENVEELYHRVKAVFANLPQHQYEHIFIDNASQDKTVTMLKTIAAQDKNVKVLVNSRNFGHIRSPFFGLMRAKGDAIMSLVCDLQDPPELIPTLIQAWEAGQKIVIGVKETVEENFLMKKIRRFYYHLLAKISTEKQIKNYTGFGLYDKQIIEILKTFDDPYPYFRGMIAEIGFEIAEIPYHQPSRKKGLTKNNLFTLHDMAMLGITGYSKVPIRSLTLFGFFCAFVSILIAITFFILKLTYWQQFSLGMAPILIGLFFFAGIQLFFLGILGEYIASIHTLVKKRPLVQIKEKINFD